MLARVKGWRENQEVNPESDPTPDSGRRYSRGLISGLTLVAGSTSLLFVVARTSDEGPALLIRSLQVLGIAAVLVGLAMVILALSLRSHVRLAAQISSRASVREVAFGGTSTTLRKELTALATSGFIDGSYRARFPLYFCVAIESDSLSLWVRKAGEPARVARFSWAEVDQLEAAPIRDGGRDFWGIRLALSSPIPSDENSTLNSSVLLRGGGPGGIFGVSQKEAQRFVALAQETKRVA